MLKERVGFSPVIQTSPEAPSEIMPPFALNNREAIDLVPDGTRVIYLQRQSVSSFLFVRELVERHTDLETLIFIPSFERLVGVGMRAFLSEKGVEFKFGRMSNQPHYDNSDKFIQHYDEKLAIWKLALEDEKKREMFAKAKVHLPEFRVVELYFNGEKISQRKIGHILKLPLYKVQRHFAAFMHLSGYESQDREVQSCARQIKENLNKIGQEKKPHNPSPEELREERRKSFAAGNTIPPRSLLEGRWENWQKIKRKLFENPELWQELDTVDPRCGQILNVFYQLGIYETKQTLLKEVKENFDPKITVERARQLKDRALDYLGLGKSSKIPKVNS